MSHPEWFEEIEAKPCTGILVVDLDEYKRAAQKEIDSGGASMHFKPKQMAKIEIRWVHILTCHSAMTGFQMAFSLTKKPLQTDRQADTPSRMRQMLLDQHYLHHYL